MLSGWESHSTAQVFLPFSTRFFAWIAIAAIPLIIAAFHGHRGLIPIAAAVVYSMLLPWCFDTIVDHYNYSSYSTTYIHTEPNFLAPMLSAAFAVFLCSWGVRVTSRALVNFGIVCFAITVVWFYFGSHIFTALGRSLGLVSLGILFLAGSWALEKTRRRLLARITGKELAVEVQ
jgi:hypothetical protein